MCTTSDHERVIDARVGACAGLLGVLNLGSPTRSVASLAGAGGGVYVPRLMGGVVHSSTGSAADSAGVAAAAAAAAPPATPPASAATVSSGS